jgi:hypothetical protein
MTRVLIFDGPKATKRFELLWAALLAAGDGKGERTPSVIRKEARLQDAFEAISVSTGVPVDGNPEPRTLRDPTARVALAQEDFDLLQQYTEKTPWIPRISRDVVDLFDFLSACPKEE